MTSKEKQLLFSLTKKDFELQTFCAGGKGGQHQNKTESGVRIIHKESGARGESREYRNQMQNRKAAFKRLIATKEFQQWHKIKCSEMMGLLSNIDEEVDRQMDLSNLKIETKQNGRWVELDKLYK